MVGHDAHCTEPLRRAGIGDFGWVDELLFARGNGSDPASQIFDVAAALAGESEDLSIGTDSDPEVVPKLVLVSKGRLRLFGYDSLGDHFPTFRVLGDVETERIAEGEWAAVADCDGFKVLAVCLCDRPSVYKVWSR